MTNEDLYKKAEYHKDMVSVRPHHKFANVDFIAGGLWMKENMIEKACKAYCAVCKMPNCFGESCSYINKFKQAMKGE